MRTSILLIILSLFVDFKIISQYTLTIDISNLKNNSGVVIVDLRDGNNNFIEGFSQEIKNNKSLIKIDNLKAGNYSFKYFHDENKNNKLDTYLIGAPKEGYGFSNNAKSRFGPPSFDSTVFELNQTTTKHCNPHYINF